MRDLEINKQTIYYALNLHEDIEIVDEEGNYTGEIEKQYSDPIKFKINKAGVSGQSDTQLFGDFTGYDRTLVTCDLSLPISEDSHLWVDNLDTTKPYDYIVKKVSKTINGIAIAIKKVDVNGNQI